STKCDGFRLEINRSIGHLNGFAHPLMQFQEVGRLFKKTLLFYGTFMTSESCLQIYSGIRWISVNEWIQFLGMFLKLSIQIKMFPSHGTFYSNFKRTLV
ncbi:MAG: hypothetical protein MN733_30495, partial [Nitrososphaera sp.]|nr:hypothetical protein [Nitrososphaera sp.]